MWYIYLYISYIYLIIIVSYTRACLHGPTTHHLPLPRTHIHTYITAYSVYRNRRADEHYMVLELLPGIKGRLKHVWGVLYTVEEQHVCSYKLSYLRESLLFHSHCMSWQNACLAWQLWEGFFHPHTHFMWNRWGHVYACLIGSIAFKKKNFAEILALQFEMYVLLNRSIDLTSCAALRENIVSCCLAKSGWFDSSFNLMRDFRNDFRKLMLIVGQLEFHCAIITRPWNQTFVKLAALPTCIYLLSCLEICDV